MDVDYVKYMDDIEKEEFDLVEAIIGCKPVYLKFQSFLDVLYGIREKQINALQRSNKLKGHSKEKEYKEKLDNLLSKCIKWSNMEIDLEDCLLSYIPTAVIAALKQEIYTIARSLNEL